MEELINWWKVAFKKNPQAWSEKQRVASAVMQFRGKPLDEWGIIVEEKEPKTWSEFESRTRNLLSDPENRMQTAYMNIRDLRQKKGQTVRDVNNTLEIWEKDLNEPLTDKAKVYHTFSALIQIFKTP
jgi:hypothetical protein